MKAEAERERAQTDEEFDNKLNSKETLSNCFQKVKHL
jgi:hypothetical protein